MNVSVSSIGSTFSTGFEVSNFQAIDLNIDGYIDFVVAGFEESDSLVWYENDGSSSFTKHVIGTVNKARDLHCLDFDFDGDIDCIFSSLVDDTIEWYLFIFSLQKKSKIFIYFFRFFTKSEMRLIVSS